MQVTVQPSRLAGTASAIGSKSDIHRLLLCSAVADRRTVIRGALRSDDIEATAGCLAGLGADVNFSGDEISVTPDKSSADKSDLARPVFDCRESGSTLRFLLPLAAARLDGAEFTGRGRLPERPIGELVDAMRSGGVVFSGEKLPLSISGRLRAGRYRISGSVSSQYISGLLMALSAVPGESRVELTSKLESAPYVKMTLHTLGLFGSEIDELADGYRVRGREFLTSPGDIRADGDWSNAACFLAAGAIGGRVTVTGLRRDSLQGDRRVLDILERFGAEVECGENSVSVSPGVLHGCTVALADIPDLLPALAVVAAFAEGETKFTEAARLRLKESDRLSTVAALINGLGGRAVEHPDGLTVYGTGLSGGDADGAGDHRIVMAAAIAATRCGCEVRIGGAQAVGKSYPGFFEDFKKLGGRADVV